ncbi:serine/threonine-protein kinase Nek11 isoform X2 [Pezoporus flaviventris]|uniref:serine/threonine-protein kinase Nek11 isoform X2 n=1 Tax=Pezoporus flaviventris TaxID=889875 RepID=UPI002AB02D80|nr:serine/threonine-protein kinase Nek11 isoform X2 [Pezoporus flaviventris]
MLKFQETAKHVSVARLNSAHSGAVIARRYTIQRKLGNGSFGSVYLVSDRRAKQGEELKVLKAISVGDLKPNETVEANLEAQLLSKLDHPAIVRFYASFVEQDGFCIITEYCEGGDLDFKIQEYKESGKIFAQRQILEWFIQLLLGVNYMHERRILHRDLKAKNIFLKNNLLKIGDFGVSRLLMGSCDLATTFTGTPYYMSPEALKHQGYNTKSDIWQRKVHLQTLQDLSEVQKMTPRERMRLRKLNAADEKAKKLKQLAEEKYQENIKKMQEFRSRNFQQLNVDVLRESDGQTSKRPIHSQPAITCDYAFTGHDEPSGNGSSQLCVAEFVDHEIPEDPAAAEEYYNEEFESCSESSEEEEDAEALQTVSKPDHQDSDIEAMVKYLESVLNGSSLGSGTVTGVSPVVPQGSRALNSTMAETKLKRMRESAIGKLGAEVFEAVYSYLKQARQQDASEEEIRRHLEKMVSRASDCFEVDQLLYFEEQLQASESHLQP